MKKAIKTLLTTAALALGLASALQAQASVVIAGTRVIYNSSDSEQTIKLTNEGKAPALTQIWLDKGDPKVAPSAIDVPFTVTPPIARIDSGKGQTLRILYVGAPLPQERESVFWLNVLEVPPKPAASEADVNTVQLAFRSRIKLFFRPVGLKGSADDAPAQISWRVIEVDNHAELEAHNPTPYHVSFASIELVGGGKTVTFNDGAMVEPGGTQTFRLSGEVFQRVGARVSYHAINDFGGPINGETALNLSVK